MTHVPRRATSRAPAEMHVAFQNPAEFLDSYAGNIGVGGMMLRADGRPLGIGERLSLHFTLPGTAREIRVVGSVVWCHAPGSDRGGDSGLVGIGFSSLQPEDRQAIAEFVERQIG